jgi:hypothetical protein
MNPFNWSAELWTLLLVVGAIVGVREGVRHYGPVQRWLQWRSRR